MKNKGIVLSVVFAIGIAAVLLLKNIAGEYRIRGVPETFIIDKKGIVRQKIVGPVQWDSPDIRAAINKLIADGS